jgi:hypothetical protein
MTKIFKIFHNKLDYLTLALAALQDPNDPNKLAPEIKDLLVPLHKLAAHQVSNMGLLMHLIRDFSELFIQLVNASPVTDAGEGIPEVVGNVTFIAINCAGHWESARGEMDRFSSEVVSTA